MHWKTLIHGDRQEAEQLSDCRDAFIKTVQVAADNYDCTLASDLILSVLKRADIDQLPDCPPTEKKAWASALALRLIRESGKVPKGWNQICHCKGCGPVYLWPGAATECDGCPWCWNRAKGLQVPQPKEAT